MFTSSLYIDTANPTEWDINRVTNLVEAVVLDGRSQSNEFKQRYVLSINDQPEYHHFNVQVVDSLTGFIEFIVDYHHYWDETTNSNQLDIRDDGNLALLLYATGHWLPLLQRYCPQQ